MRLLTKFEIATAAAEFESFAPTLFFAVPTIYIRLLSLRADVTGKIGRTMRLLSRFVCAISRARIHFPNNSVTAF